MTMYTQTQLDDAICAAYDDLLTDFNAKRLAEMAKIRSDIDPVRSLEYIAKADTWDAAAIVLIQRKRRFLVESIERLEGMQRQVLAETE